MTDKTEQQIAFEAKVQAAALKLTRFDADQLELIDLIACDLFSGGNPQGYSEDARMIWDDLKPVPPYTRGDLTYPAKLQWRIKAVRIVELMNYWMASKTKAPHILANEQVAN